LTFSPCAPNIASKPARNCASVIPAISIKFSSNNSFKLYSDNSLSVSLDNSKSSRFINSAVSQDFSDFSESEFSSERSSSSVFILSESFKILSISYSIPVSNNSSCSVSVCSGDSCSGVLPLGEPFCISSRFFSACSILSLKYLLQINISIVLNAISAIVMSGFSEYFILPIKFNNFVSLVIFFVPISILNKSLNILKVYSVYATADTLFLYQFQNLSNSSLVPSGG